MVNQRIAASKTRQYTVNGRLLLVERLNSHKWEAWYDDDHSVIYEAKTLKEVVEEALGDA